MTGPRLAYFGSSTAVDGGSELCLLRMAKHFSDRRSVVLFLPDDGPLFREAASAGVDCINLEFLRLRKRSGVDWIRWFHSVRGARERLRKECLRRRVELIHFNDFIDLPFYSAAKGLGIPSVAHLRLIVGSRLVRGVYRATVRRSITRVAPVSNAVRRAMLGEGTRIPHRVIYDPAPDSMHFHPGPSREKREPFRLVLVSKLLENKGHLNFCSAALELERRSPGRFAFAMAAPSSPGREEYEAKVRAKFAELPAVRSQFIPGATHSELGDLLRRADLLVHLPDTEDSFPGVVLEAMACGVPVLAYRVGGIPEQLDQGRAGLLVEPGDDAAVVREVEALADDPTRWESLAATGIKRVSTVFSAETHFDALQGLYEEILRG